MDDAQADNGGLDTFATETNAAFVPACKNVYFCFEVRDLKMEEDWDFFVAASGGVFGRILFVGLTKRKF